MNDYLIKYLCAQFIRYFKQDPTVMSVPKSAYVGPREQYRFDIRLSKDENWHVYGSNCYFIGVSKYLPKPIDPQIQAMYVRFIEVFGFKPSRLIAMPDNRPRAKYLFDIQEGNNLENEWRMVGTSPEGEEFCLAKEL